MAKDPSTGDVIDRRYELRREIARGGMGAVFEAEQKVTGRVVAVKLVHGNVVRAKDAEERLLREARAISDSRHPGIVEVLDAGICPEAGPFLVLEMLVGRTLDSIIVARRRLPLADVAQVGRQMCIALAFVHARGIVHRDLKPSNVFVAREGSSEVIKLFDFGIAALVAPQDRKLTKASDLIGTPEYMSPEQLFAEGPVDHRADVYAAGVTLFECLTGDVPFAGTYPQVLTKVAQSHHAPSVRAQRDDVNEELDAVIARALAKDAVDRFDDAAELGDALRRAMGFTAGQTNLLRSAGPSTRPGTSPAGSDRPARSPVESAPIPLVRRLFARLPYVTVVEVDCGDGTIVGGRIEDISVGGVLMRTEAAMPHNARVRLRFALPLTNQMVDLVATTRWSRSARGGDRATGLEFLDLPNDIARLIASYVQQP